jgi:hypothetical protein
MCSVDALFCLCKKKKRKRSRSLFKLALVKHTSKHYIYITGLGSQAPYVHAFRMILSLFLFCFSKRMLYEILPFFLLGLFALNFLQLFDIFKKGDALLFSPFIEKSLNLPVYLCL